MARGRGKATPHDLEAMKHVSSMLQRLLAENNLKQSHLADRLEIPRSSFNEYVKGTALPRPGNVQKIADYFGLKKSDIDPRFKSTRPSTASHRPVETIPPKVVYLDQELKEPRHSAWIDHGEQLLKEQSLELRKEPLYEYRIYEKLSAGTGTAIYEDHSYDLAYFDKELDHDIASWIYGDSMEPKYKDGQVALIKETGWDYDGAIYAVVWDGQTYIKKVYKEEDGLRLVSLNDKYDDKFARWEEEPRIIGKVVGNFMPVER